MPRTSTTRNLLGSIIPRTVVVDGKKVKRFDARRRYTKLDGSRGEKSKRCLSRSEAHAQLLNFDTEIQKELAGETGPVVHTFFELCDYFETEFVTPAVFSGERQISGYRGDIKTLKSYIKSYKDFIGDINVLNVNYEILRKYAKQIATTPIIFRSGKTGGLPKAASVNRKLGPLRRILNVGIQLGWLQVNPFTGGRRLIDPSAEEPRERVLSYDEEARLLAVCEGPDIREYERCGKKVISTVEDNPRKHLRPAIIFAIESGMRKRELFTTTRSQVDFDRKVIELNARQTKALKRRSIPMSARLEHELRTLFAKQKFAPGDMIFGGAKDFDTAFATACERASITDLRFHDLRHTAATYMDEAGISDAARRNAIGHSSIRVGQRYVNTTQDVIDASRVKMDEFRKKLEERQTKEAAA